MNTAFEDRRPWWSVFVTGHPAGIPAGSWMFCPLARESFEQPGAAFVRAYLDAVLYRRREACRVTVYCRGGRPHEAGVDAIVRAYCSTRKLPCLVASDSPDVYGPEALYRRDLAAVARCHAVVWFGPREVRDPVTLAAVLGVPYRVVPFPVEVEPDEEGVPDGPRVSAEILEASAGR